MNSEVDSDSNPNAHGTKRKPAPAGFVVYKAIRTHGSVCTVEMMGTFCAEKHGVPMLQSSRWQVPKRGRPLVPKEAAMDLLISVLTALAAAVTILDFVLDEWRQARSRRRDSHQEMKKG